MNLNSNPIRVTHDSEATFPEPTKLGRLQLLNAAADTAVSVTLDAREPLTLTAAVANIHLDLMVSRISVVGLDAAPSASLDIYRA